MLSDEKVRPSVRIKCLTAQEYTTKTRHEMKDSLLAEAMKLLMEQNNS